MAHRNEWRKSSYSGPEGGNCIEVKESPKTIAVRDSKDKTGPMLTFSHQQWAMFVTFSQGHSV